MGILIVFAIMAVVGSPILFMPGWRSFAVALGLYVAVILWITFSVSQPTSSCTTPECGGGAMAGFLIGSLLQTVAWLVLVAFTIVKVAMLASRR